MTQSRTNLWADPSPNVLREVEKLRSDTVTVTVTDLVGPPSPPAHFLRLLLAH